MDSNKTDGVGPVVIIPSRTLRLMQATDVKSYKEQLRLLSQGRSVEIQHTKEGNYLGHDGEPTTTYGPRQVWFPRNSV